MRYVVVIFLMFMAVFLVIDNMEARVPIEEPVSVAAPPEQVKEEEQEACRYYDALPIGPELQGFIYDTCEEYGIAEYFEVVLGIIWHESHFRPDLISSTNDYGYMQINSANHRYLRNMLGITDFLDPLQNIQGGIHLLSYDFHMYDDDVHRVLTSYNMGSVAASKHWKEGFTATRYSRCVMEHVEKIKQNIYDGSP